MKPHYLIIGAGLTGLSTALYLKRTGAEVTVLEKAPRAGGSVHTVLEEGYQMEEGPHTLQVNSLELAFALGELGVSDLLVQPDRKANKRFIIKNGQTVPIPTGPIAFLKSPLFSFRGKCRLLSEPFIRADTNRKEESLASFTRRRLGQEVLDYAVNPFVGGVYAGDPEKLSLQAAFPTLATLESEGGSLFRGMLARRKKTRKLLRTFMASFQGGMQGMVDAMAHQLGDDLKTSTEITSLLPLSNNTWDVEFGGQSHNFKAVIITTPAFALPHFPFPKTLQEALAPFSQIDYPPVAVLNLGFRREAVEHPLDGFGALAPSLEKRFCLGALFPSSLFPDRAPEGHCLLTAFVGGSKHPERLDMDDEELLRKTIDDLTPLLKLKEDPVYHRIRRWPRAIPQYALGHDRFAKLRQDVETQWPGLFIAGNYLDGIAASQCLLNGKKTATRALDCLTVQQSDGSTV